MQGGPDARRLPRAQPPPTRLAAAAHFGTRQVRPLHAGPQNQDDAGQRRPIRDVRPATFRLLGLRRTKRLDHRPEVVGYKSIHALPTRPNGFCPTLLFGGPYA